MFAGEEPSYGFVIIIIIIITIIIIIIIIIISNQPWIPAATFATYVKA